MGRSNLGLTFCIVVLCAFQTSFGIDDGLVNGDHPKPVPVEERIRHLKEHITHIEEERRHELATFREEIITLVKKIAHRDYAEVLMDKVKSGEIAGLVQGDVKMHSLANRLHFVEEKLGDLHNMTDCTLEDMCHRMEEQIETLEHLKADLEPTQTPEVVTEPAKAGEEDHPEAHHEIEVTEGENVTLSCGDHWDVSSDDILWYKDGHVIVSRKSGEIKYAHSALSRRMVISERNSLSLFHAKVGDSAYYMCKLYTDDLLGVKVEKFTTELHVKPKDTVVRIGVNVTLPCGEPPEGHEVDDVLWYKGEEYLGRGKQPDKWHDGMAISEDHSLTLTHVSLDDTAAYTCEIHFEDDEMDVMDNPRFTMKLRVEESSCPRLRAPDNGAIVCAGRAQVCATLCGNDFLVDPSNALPPPVYACQADGTWVNNRISDCYFREHGRPFRRLRAFHFTGRCKLAKQQIMNNFVGILKKQGLCLDSDGDGGDGDGDGDGDVMCVPEKMMVRCGDEVDGYLRRKRSTSRHFKYISRRTKN